MKKYFSRNSRQQLAMCMHIESCCLLFLEKYFFINPGYVQTMVAMSVIHK